MLLIQSLAPTGEMAITTDIILMAQSRRKSSITEQNGLLILLLKTSNHGTVKRSKWLQALWSEGSPKRSARSQSELIVIDDLNVVWRRSARRTRSLALKLDRQGQLIAMTPVSTSSSELRRFVRSRDMWIRRQLAQHQQLETQKQAEKGQSLWFMGEQLKVESLPGRKNQISLKSGQIQCVSPMTLDRQVLDRRLTKWLRTQAESELPVRVQQLSQKTGLHGNGLQIKSYTARWGSCRHDGLIQLNWKLIKTPSDVIEYVIVHELSHLSHFNHSAAFWDQVRQFCPEYKTHRKWLKENGRLLISP